MKNPMGLEEAVLTKNETRRHYTKEYSPKDWYLDHPELHNLSRTALSLEYSGLYRSLLRWGQINVIPAQKEYVAHGKIRYSPSEIEKIVASFEKFNGIALRASRYFSCGINSVLRYWRNAGLKIAGHRFSGIRLSDEKVKEITDAYQTYRGNAAHASKNTDYSPGSILKYWRRAGLTIRRKGRPSLVK